MRQPGAKTTRDMLHELRNCLAGSVGLGIMSGYEKIVSTSAEYVNKLHEVTERICKEKIESFV